jgi:hypothetical protein
VSRGGERSRTKDRRGDALVDAAVQVRERDGGERDAAAGARADRGSGATSSERHDLPEEARRWQRVASRYEEMGADERERDRREVVEVVGEHRLAVT